MNACASALVRRLAADGGWLSRTKLCEGLNWSVTRVDDELADLVQAEQLMFNPRTREYRLAGALMARRAARRLLQQPGHKHCVVALQSADKKLLKVGIARLEPDPADPEGADLLAVAELELPYSLGAAMKLFEAAQGMGCDPEKNTGGPSR